VLNKNDRGPRKRAFSFLEPGSCSTAASSPAFRPEHLPAVRLRSCEAGNSTIAPSLPPSRLQEIFPERKFMVNVRNRSPWRNFRELFLEIAYENYPWILFLAIFHGNCRKRESDCIAGNSQSKSNLLCFGLKPPIWMRTGIWVESTTVGVSGGIAAQAINSI